MEIDSAICPTTLNTQVCYSYTDKRSNAPTTVNDFTTALGKGNFTSISGVGENVLVAATDTYQTGYAESFKVTYLPRSVFGGCAIIAALYSPSLDHKLRDEVVRRFPLTPSSEKLPGTESR